MTISDIKIYLLNSVALVASFSGIEALLKIVLLIGSIIYTSQRIHINYLENKLYGVLVDIKTYNLKKWVLLNVKTPSGWTYGRHRNLKDIIIIYLI